jgi:hypothetical protein
MGTTQRGTEGVVCELITVGYVKRDGCEDAVMGGVRLGSRAFVV